MGAILLFMALFFSSPFLAPSAGAEQADEETLKEAMIIELEFLDAQLAKMESLEVLINQVKTHTELFSKKYSQGIETQNWDQSEILLQESGQLWDELVKELEDFDESFLSIRKELNTFYVGKPGQSTTLDLPGFLWDWGKQNWLDYYTKKTAEDFGGKSFNSLPLLRKLFKVQEGKFQLFYRFLQGERSITQQLINDLNENQR